MSSPGYSAELLVEPGESAHTFNASSERYVFDSESVRRTTEMLPLVGIHGSRSVPDARVTTGRYVVAGDIVMRPGRTELENWLPRILCGGENSYSYNPSDAIDSDAYFGLLIDKVGDIHQYNDCVVSQCRLSATSGNVLQMQLTIIGKTETLTSWPSPDPDEYEYSEASRPLLMSSATLTLGGTEYDVESFDVQVNNAVDSLFGYSESAIAFTPTDRIVTLRVSTDYTGALYGAETAIAGSIVFEQQIGSQVTLTFPKLRAPKITPVVAGKQAVMNDIVFTAYADTTTGYEFYVAGDIGDDIIVPLLLMA